MEQSNQHIIQIQKLKVLQGDKILLRPIDMLINENDVVALVGPIGNGKTVLLRSINQLYKQDANYKVSGKIFFKNQLITKISTINLRQTIGMIFSKPTLFPMSIFENLAFGLRLNGVRDEKIITRKIRHILNDLHLFDSLHKKLHQSVKGLDIEQQQVLCLARTLILNPKVILMDKPTLFLNSSPKSRFEDLIFELKQKYTIIVTAENKQQAGRISDKVAFFYKGQLVEYGQTKNIFTHPQESLTESYITGRIS